MDTIVYSFIIPHKNSLQLLKRCLSSIPIRADIEVIVIDDNSTLENRPQKERIDETVVLLNENESKGAGHARNIGIQLARGKWILFADCDDYYAPDFIKYLDLYKNKEYDIIYFGAYINYDIEKRTWKKKFPYYQFIYEYLKNPNNRFNTNNIKYGINAPWNKMFSKKYIHSISAQFEEIPKGNDIYFVHYCGFHTNNITVINENLYYYIKNKDSITWSKMNKNKLIKSLSQIDKSMEFVRKSGAWNLYAPFHLSMYHYLKTYGIIFWIKYYSTKFFFNTPAYIIWYHKFIIKIKILFKNDI